MGKVTYTDKVDLAINPVDETNKVTAANLNEIKTVVNEHDDLIDAIINRSGWGDYVDTQYTEVSPFTVLSGTKVSLPNNAGSVVDFQKPTDIATFYDSATQTITGRNGDGLAVVIEFKVKPLSAAANTRVRTSIDSGGAVGEIYKIEQTLTKGNGVAQY